MIYGLYRGGYGDLYKVTPSAYPRYVWLKNLSNHTESLLSCDEVQGNIDKGWMTKITVSDLGSDQRRKVTT